MCFNLDLLLRYLEAVKNIFSQIVVVNDGDGSHATKSKTNRLRHDFSAAVICLFVAGRVKIFKHMSYP